MIARRRPRVPIALALALAAAACGGGGAVPDADAAGDSRADGDVARDDAGAADAEDAGATDVPPGDLIAWTQGPSRKVQPTTAPGAGTEIRLEGPRASYLASQVVVRAAGNPLRGVRVQAADLSDGAGHVLAARNVTLFREAFIDFTGVDVMGGNEPVPGASATGDGRIPDPLIPLVDPYDGGDAGQPFDVPAETNQPVWVDVFVPGDTPAGTYSGTIRVADADGGEATVPLTVDVWDLVLPDMRSVTTHFRLIATQLMHFHRDLATCSGDDCYLNASEWSREVVRRYEELTHVHRVETGSHFEPVPHSGCTPPADWSDFDSVIAPYMDGTYWEDGVPSSVIGTPFAPGADWGLEARCSQAEYTALAAAYASHYRERGWFDRAVVYALDEPPDERLPMIATNSAWLQDADPGWKAHVMATKWPAASNVDILNPALGIYCVALKQYDSWYWTDGDIYGREEWPGLFDQGIRLWFYESNAQGPPYPTFATNTLDGAEPQMLMWGSWHERATGFLYWATEAWNIDDPWGPAIDYGKTGDGVLLYPGNHDGIAAPLGSPPEVEIDGPIPSYRLKMIRAGLQDWALFALAEANGLADLARSEVSRAYWRLGGCTWSGCDEPPDGTYWETDEALMDGIRRTVAMAIIDGP